MNQLIQNIHGYMSKGDDIMNDLLGLLGKTIITRDGERFMVVSFTDGEKGLLNLDDYKVRKVDDITKYICQYHFGIYDTADTLILNK